MSRHRPHKGERTILEIIKPFGYYIVQGRKHQKIYDSAGRLLLSFANTPSCSHWYKNVINQLIKNGKLPGVKKL